MDMRRAVTAAIGILTVFTLMPIRAKADRKPEAGDNVMVVASTVPNNGDVNPYGVARVHHTQGNLHAGNLLVSNFNNSANIQGTGTTIIQVSPQGSASQFAQIDPNHLPGSCPGGVGLTTALVVLRSGWVIVGSLPTTSNGAVLSGSGCLLVLNSTGQVVETLTSPMINGPWDMTALDKGGDDVQLFVTNVLNGLIGPGAAASASQATVIRIQLDVSKHKMPQVDNITVIGSGFTSKTDPVALVIGPTGVGLSSDDDDVLYVADTAANRIAAIHKASSRQTSAGTGVTLTQNGSLNAPLGLAVDHHGDIATVNGGDGNLVITQPDGTQVFTKLLDSTGTPPGNGALFGLAFARGGLYFVDDVSNTLNVLLH
jgi:hypothetical protein